MTRQHQVPSQELWGITPFRFTTPDGWSVRQTVDQLAYMTREGESGTNCGIQWKRVSPRIDLRQVAQLSHGVMRRIDREAKVAQSKFSKLNNHLAYLRVMEFRASTDGPLQHQLYTAVFGPRLGPDQPVELFEIIGHVPAGRDDLMREVGEIVGSFRFPVAVRRIEGSAGETGTELEQKGA